MKKILTMLIIFVLFGGSAWGYYNWIYSDYPSKLRQLDRNIQLRDEKLISAQIIHQQLDLVANLIEKNLALSKTDSLTLDGNLTFLDYITGMLDVLDIDALKIEPGKRSARLDYIRTPYTLTMFASYKQVGKFVNELEKSERLITIEQFEIDNAVRKSGAEANKDDLDKHKVVLRVSTLTLIKQR